SDRLPDRAGDRGGVPAREHRRDPHRRVSVEPARARAGHQQRRRDQRHVHRPHPRRTARADQLAPDLSRLGAAGVIGMIWSKKKLREIGTRREAPIDWLGNLTFAAGLILVMIGITYGIRPYGSSPMGWHSPFVLGCLSLGVLLLVVFAFVELRVEHPM